MAEPQRTSPERAEPQRKDGSSLARLKRRADFLRVAGVRRKWVTPGVMLQVANAKPDAQQPGPDVTTIQIGFTASRKVGNAVVRNRARRRLKAVVDEVMPLYAKPGLDYVLIARRDTATRPYALLVEDLKLALGKTGALRADAPRTEGEAS
ncbi:ribonuclease P protein component [Oceanibaculum sp.]|uniref:ribonuclease P protein component n=1 Tax=Oceanibaculum sp. TaxID=1903597 RepID=UPI002585A027|nr:ribonuclease P protein component [Oceanibaculum sp.]MCH2393654.1 ribonuclease P protein component [Oceanibaculum sp.]